jgi:hypothetical protein
MYHSAKELDAANEEEDKGDDYDDDSDDNAEEEEEEDSIVMEMMGMVRVVQPARRQAGRKRHWRLERVKRTPQKKQLL